MYIYSVRRLSCGVNYYRCFMACLFIVTTRVTIACGTSCFDKYVDGLGRYSDGLLCVDKLYICELIYWDLFLSY